MAKLKVLIIGSKEDKKILLNYLNLKSYEIIFHDEDKRSINFKYFSFILYNKIFRIILVYLIKLFIYYFLISSINPDIILTLNDVSKFITLWYPIFLI